MMSVKIARILHAGYLFEYEDAQILFDPVFENPFSRNCYAFPDVKFDDDQIKNLHPKAVFISHYHDDHCSFESLNKLSKETPIYLYCIHDEMFALIRKLGFKNVVSIELNKPIQINGFTITARKALDEDVDSIFHIQAGEFNILNVVDSWIGWDTVELLSQTKWDLVLWPFQTMQELQVIAPTRFEKADLSLPEEWLQQIKMLNPKYIVPSSCQFKFEDWSWYNSWFFPISYSQFQKQVNANVVRLNPGVAVRLTSSALEFDQPLKWIRPIGFQDVDYRYDHSISPLTTAVIAQKFAPLSSEQNLRVKEYLKIGLLVKYRSLPASEDPYFAQQVFWKLLVYDHIGRETAFCYSLFRNQIELVSMQDDSKIGWLTCVPFVKVYAALFEGESLTSMYMRINDFVFSPEIESQINEAEVTEDPLMRCLFTNVFASYQKAQLAKLL